MKRSLLSGSAAVLTVLMVSANTDAGSAPADAPTAALDRGQLRGDLQAGQAVFVGIPYAAPPVGDLRWREPRPPEPVIGTQDATSFGLSCMQTYDIGPIGEDCLTLNVWTPEWPVRQPKAVMVWFHGGGDTSGGTNMRYYYGDSLAKRDVVVVSVNYRLGVFGFLALPELSAESPHGASGNYGLLDQIASLRWVRDNIAAFGGDPSNVTIFGQSAGAADIQRLMVSPLAQGLYHRAIAESGAARRYDPPLADIERQCTQAIANLRVPAENKLAHLRGLSADTVLNGFARGNCRPLNLDGYVLPEQTIQVWSEGRQHPVPFLIGNAARESYDELSFPDLKADIQTKYGEFAPRAFELYGLNGARAPAPHPLYGHAYQQWGADHHNRCRVVAQGISHSNAGHPFYQYEFSRQLPGQRPDTNMHSNEIYSVFGIVFLPEAMGHFSDADRQLADQIQTYWTNFAKTGDPNGRGLPRWEQFDAESRAYMAFDEAGATPGNGLRQAFCDLFLEVEAARPTWLHPERSARW